MLIICKDCGLEKEKYHGCQCRECRLSYLIEYRNEHKESISEVRHEYFKTYRETNKERIKASAKNYYERTKEAKKAYYNQNIETIRVSRRETEKKRRSKDPSFAMRQDISRRVSADLKRAGSSKKGKSVKTYLPNPISEVMAHIESQWVGHNAWMNWGNRGPYNVKTWDDNDPATWTWQIDHITPQSDLPYTSMEDENFKKCWALENLRPLSAKQNLLDGVRRTRHRKKAT
jgi:hypothetical protein